MKTDKKQTKDHKETRCDNEENSLFTILERKSGSCRRKVAEFAANHVVCDLKSNILLAVVDLEFKANKVGQNSAGTSVSSDGGLLLRGLTQRQRNNMGAYDWLEVRSRGWRGADAN